MDLHSARIRIGATMAAWSSIFCGAGQNFLKIAGFRTALLKNGQARCMSEERVMQIQPSRYQWHLAKNWFHFYFLLGAIPVGIAITLINVFIGPGTLQEIPEGYVPKEWEYYQHPIKRFFQRYFFPSSQEQYERMLHHVYHEEQLRKVRLLEQHVRNMMHEKHDYRGPYFKEFSGSKYLYIYRKHIDSLPIESE